jgi:hypothetical protein
MISHITLVFLAKNLALAGKGSESRAIFADPCQLPLIKAGGVKDV